MGENGSKDSDEYKHYIPTHVKLYFDSHLLSTCMCE